jgi:hypothetical protein
LFRIIENTKLKAQSSNKAEIKNHKAQTKHKNKLSKTQNFLVSILSFSLPWLLGFYNFRLDSCKIIQYIVNWCYARLNLK